MVVQLVRVSVPVPAALLVIRPAALPAAKLRMLLLWPSRSTMPPLLITSVVVGGRAVPLLSNSVPPLLVVAPA